MKRICLILLVVASARCALTQDTWGKISFYNRNIPIRGGGSTGGGNGNGTYNAGVWTDYTRTDGAGSLSPSVTIGLFLGSDSETATPLATTPFRSTNFREYFAVTQDVQIPGVKPGESTTLMIRAWQGPSFSSAQVNPGYQWAEWKFTTEPLGGVTTNGVTIATPGLTGWGPEDGSGLVFGQVLNTIISPNWTGDVLFAPANSSLWVYWYSENTGPTNFALFANSTVLTNISISGDVGQRLFSLGGLTVGDYNLISVVNGYYGASATSPPVHITVVAPIAIEMTAPQINANAFKFDYAVNAGLRYRVETSPDLLNWQPVVTNAPSGGVANFSDTTITTANRFYRVFRLPDQ